MKEFSQIMTILPKAFQEFDVMPFEAIAITNRLKLFIFEAKKSFENNKIPEIGEMHGYKMWHFFKNSTI